MGSYKCTFTDGSEALMHYGVLGMKWGHRKDPRSGSGSRSGLSDNQKKWIKRAAVGAGVIGLGAAAHFTGADKALINAVRRARIKKLPGNTGHPSAVKKLGSGSQALAKRSSGSPFGAAKYAPKASKTKALPSWRSQGTMRNGSFRPARNAGTVKPTTHGPFGNDPVGRVGNAWNEGWARGKSNAQARANFDAKDFMRRQGGATRSSTVDRLKPLQQRGTKKRI